MDEKACLDDELLAGIATGERRVSPGSALEAHIAACRDCRALLAILVRNESEPLSSAPSSGSLRDRTAAAAASALGAHVCRAFDVCRAGDERLQSTVGDRPCGDCVGRGGSREP